MGKNVLLQVDHLKKYFKVGKSSYLHAVDDVSFSLNKGETLGVVGESGCGKTTLGRTLLRLQDPTDGKIIFNGQDITKCSRNEMKKLRKDMQIIFQDPYSSLNPRMTVKEAIAEPLIIQKVLNSWNKNEIEKTVYDIMDRVGLSRRLINSYPHELDGGRRQRIGVARAIVLRPQFIVCDEPVSALDVSIQAQVLNLMQDLQKDMGLTYMFITHDLSVVKHLSTDIAVMYLGQLVEKAPAKELFHNPLHPYTNALLSAIPIPDPEASTKRILLKGELSSPIDPQKGCRFAKRCAYATEKCNQADIPLEEVEKNHFVACHKVAEKYKRNKCNTHL